MLLLAFMPSSATTANLARYDFTGAAGDQAFQAPAFTLGALTASTLTRGAGLAPNLGGNSLNSSGWTTALTPDPDDYYEFTLTPTGGYALNLDRISFAERRSGSGIRNYQIRSSLDGFADEIDSVPVYPETSRQQKSPNGAVLRQPWANASEFYELSCYPGFHGYFFLQPS